MDEDKRIIYELRELVEAQKTKLTKLGKRVEIAHRQRVKSIPTITLIKVIIERVIKHGKTKVRITN